MGMTKGLKDHVITQAKSGWYHGARRAFVPGSSGMKAFLFLQAAEKAFLLRSRSFEPLNVPHAYASGFSLLAALPEGLFERLVIGGQPWHA